MSLLTKPEHTASAARAVRAPVEIMDVTDAALRPVDAERARDATPDLDWEALGGRSWYRCWGRRGLDLVLLGVFGLPAVAVGLVIAACNLAVFRRPREVFFVQPRVGYRGRVFPMVKFRTMRAVRRERDEFGSWGSGEDVLRVTRLGKLLRNTHLDELPQLLNVALGQMAIVGPRPEMIQIEEWAAQNIPAFTTRMAVPPGITGYSQVTQGYTGNDVEAYREKFRIADWYRRSQSLSLDLEILARTALWMARGRGWQWNRGAGAAPVADSGDATD